MKINIEDFLQNIDNYFKGKTQKDVYMTYVMIFAVIFAFSYYYFGIHQKLILKQKELRLLL